MSRAISTKRRARALLGALAAVALGAPCCQGDPPAPPSAITTLRILSVTADRPYAAPGDKVTFKLTFHDALGAAAEGPRDVQVMWLGGCTNPIAENYVACYPQVFEVLQGAASGDPEKSKLIKTEIAGPEKSGAPDAVEFELDIDDDILMKGPEDAPPRTYSTAYVFFTVCAGTVRPATQKDASFPLECVGADGNVLGQDSYVAGYTQVYVFADGRANPPPEIKGISLDGAAIEDNIDDAPAVERCTTPVDDEEQGGCAPPQENGCKTYAIEALVDDIIDLDPESKGPDGAPQREAVWVNYYADRGELESGIKLVSNADSGFNEEHEVTWIPPAEPGPVTLWAVVRDARGGSSVARRFLQVK